jgi:predicted RNA-binding Zn-ribbon protein involved in translation (DUF1610 family)
MGINLKSERKTVSDEETITKCPCCGGAMTEVSKNDKATKYRCSNCGLSDLKLN